MVLAYNIVHAPASLNPPSEHTLGTAIDMSITWRGDIRVLGGDGQEYHIGQPWNDQNHVLWQVGATYGVYKLASDRPHWSIDGH